jgi:hypothetical protein
MAANPLPPGWLQSTTEEGDVYFSSEALDLTVWTLWVHTIDASGTEHWANAETGAVSGTCPPQSVLDKYTAVIDRHGYVLPVALSEKTARALVKAVAKLPPAWTQLKTEEGHTYYYNESTGVTTWDFPLEAVESPLPDSPVPQVVAPAVAAAPAPVLTARQIALARFRTTATVVEATVRMQHDAAGRVLLRSNSSSSCVDV